MISATWIELIGYVSTALNVAGNLMLAEKWRTGWTVRIVAILSWGLYGVLVDSRPFVLNAVIFFFINCRGWWKWRAEEKKVKWFEEQRRLA